jgi:hypothetical protein
LTPAAGFKTIKRAPGVQTGAPEGLPRKTVCREDGKAFAPRRLLHFFLGPLERFAGAAGAGGRPDTKGFDAECS